MQIRELSSAEVEKLNRVMDNDMIRRSQAVQAALVISGSASEGEVFISDVLDIAAFLLAPSEDDGPRDIETGARPGQPGYRLENDPTHQD